MLATRMRQAAAGASTGVDWWLSGGASGCVAAYAAKGAASLAASYVNLANPGTYNAAPGVAPTWAAGTGWTFNGSTQYLITGITPTSSYSMFIRFSGGQSNTSHYIMGSIGSLSSPYSRFFLVPYFTGNTVRYGLGGAVAVSPGLTAGIIGLAGSQGYRNGTADGGAIPADGTSFIPIYIGDINGSYQRFAGNIQALAIYSTTLTAPQVLAVSTAMAAL